MNRFMREYVTDERQVAYYKVTYNKHAKNMHFRNTDDERVNSNGFLADIMFRAKTAKPWSRQGHVLFKGVVRHEPVLILS